MTRQEERGTSLRRWRDSGAESPWLGWLAPTSKERGSVRHSTPEGVRQLSLLQRLDLQTITKTRILSDSQQQLLRLDRDGDRIAFAAASEELLAEILP